MGPLTRNAYEVTESFVSDAGREYVKVNYKGIDQTGYLSRISGPGRTITEKWYNEKKKEEEEDNVRVVATFKRSTSNTTGYGPGDEVTGTIEVGGVFAPKDAPTKPELIQKIYNILENAGIGGWMAQSYAKKGTNIQRKDTEAEPTGYDPTVSFSNISFKKGPTKEYDIDENQETFDV